MKNQIGFLFKKDDLKKNFTQVPNELFELDVDPYAKLILAFLHSKPNDFVFYRKKMGQTLGISRQKIARAMNELVERQILTPVPGGFKLVRVTRNVTVSNTEQVTMGADGVTKGTDSVLKVTPDVIESNTNKKTESNKTIYKEGNQPLHSPTPSSGFGSARLIPEEEKTDLPSISINEGNSIKDLPSEDSKNKSENVTPTTKEFVISPTFNEFVSIIKGMESKFIEEASTAMGRTLSLEDVYFSWRNSNMAVPKYLNDFKGMFDTVQFDKFKEMNRNEFLKTTELLFTDEHYGDAINIYAQLRREVEQKVIESKVSPTEKVMPIVFSSSKKNNWDELPV